MEALYLPLINKALSYVKNTNLVHSLQQSEAEMLRQPQISSEILGKLFHLSSATLISERANASLVSQGHYKQEFNSGNKIFEAQIGRHKRLTSALILSPLKGRFRTTYALCLIAVNGRKTITQIVWADFSCSYSVQVKLISLFLLINEDSLHSSDSTVSAESFHR